MSSFSRTERRNARMNAFVDQGQIISDRAYNLIIGLVVLYGLVVNYILCVTVGTDIFYSMNPIAFLILYAVLAIAGTVIANRSDSAVISFVGYNMVVLPIGVLVSFLVDVYGGVDSTVVSGAIYYTVIITAIMILAAMLFPRFFERIGGVLMVSLIGILIAGLFMSLFHMYSSVYSYVVAIIFALYIGYDFWRSQQYPRTANNAVDCALDIYLDIINLFIRILEILGRNGGGSSRRAQ
ncbi:MULTISPECIES: Bax inhibitor-1 family protein [Agathobacter]|uniref:BAX inhibitor (BI)-1/YccA family protein n=1 Tax=Agathobacter ruminis TaxID=1712665 RepID=A0A2G3E675_9FIRM|nr:MULTISPECIES: Bax inhibitor-1 family protein [Agathobacter]MBQ1680680.1 US12 family protein [Agathobacter sp.]MCR5677350.1 Bax inhibitor-1 family protein [Agathobacter sp.]MDC7301609.1 Bax inhibitor-1 family protein [Agathobacter ruminis]PHU38701.1 hypothetical protein CSX02_01770 [Agathobacter ruminis]